MGSLQAQNFPSYQLSDRSQQAQRKQIESTEQHKRQRKERITSLAKKLQKREETNGRRKKKIDDLSGCLSNTSQEMRRLQKKSKSELQAAEKAAASEFKRVEKAADKRVKAADKRAERAELRAARARAELKWLKEKKRALQQQRRWDGRGNFLKTLSGAERLTIVKSHINSRIYDRANQCYTSQTNKFNPAICTDDGLSMNRNRPMLEKVWEWWVEEATKPDRLQHRTTLSRAIVARSDVTLRQLHQKLESPEVESFCAIIDSSERSSRNHTSVAITFVMKHLAEADFYQDSVCAGKTGKDMADFLVSIFAPSVRHKFKAIEYDTTASNTGAKAGLRVLLEGKLGWQLLEVLCIIHVGAMAMCDLCAVLFGGKPSKLKSGAKQNPEPIPLLLFLYFLHKRESTVMHEAYFVLYNQKYDMLAKAVLSRWGYVPCAARQVTERWGHIKAIGLLKTAEPITSQWKPSRQPIAIINGRSFYDSQSDCLANQPAVAGSELPQLPTYAPAATPSDQAVEQVVSQLNQESPEVTEQEVVEDDGPAELNTEPEAGAAEAASEIAIAAEALARMEAGGEVLEATAGCEVARATASSGNSNQHHLQPQSSIEQANLFVWKKGSAGKLWRAMLTWMSGECGMELYLLLRVLLKASEIWEHVHHWAMGQDQAPRLLNSDGSGRFVCLPAGRRACQLPDFVLLVVAQSMAAQSTAAESCAAEFKTMDEFLPATRASELKSRVPRAHATALNKFLKHAQTYELLPWSLVRVSEGTGPVFLRAFLSIFFPQEAEAHGLTLPAALLQESELIETYNYLVGVASVEDTIQMLALAESKVEVQLCHAALIQHSIRQQVQKVYVAELAKAKAADGSKRVSARHYAIAERKMKQAHESQQCFTLGFREQCQSCSQFLSQAIRVAASGCLHHSHSGPTLPPIAWGAECNCATGQHQPQCWRNVELVYGFLETNFFHIYVHQMIVEGNFNIHDHNQMNATAPLKQAKLNQKRNGSHKMDCNNSELHQQIRTNKEAIKNRNKNLRQRTSDVRSELTKPK